MELPVAGSFVKLVTKGLEIDIGRVDELEKGAPGGLGHVARGDGHRCDLLLPTFASGVDGVFSEDERIVVGEGDASAASLPGRFGNGLGLCLRAEPFDFAGLRDIPVLAELAAEIAASCAEAKDRASRKKMIQGLLLDGIDAETCGAAVAAEDDLVSFALAYETEGTLSLLELAVARAEFAAQPAVGKLALKDRRGRGVAFSGHGQG